MIKMTLIGAVAVLISGCQVAPSDRTTETREISFDESTFVFPGDPDQITASNRERGYVEIAAYPGRQKFAVAIRSRSGTGGVLTDADHEFLGGFLNLDELDNETEKLVNRGPVRRENGIRYTRYQVEDMRCVIAYRPFDRIGDSSSYRASGIYASCPSNVNASAEDISGRVIRRVREITYHQP